MTHTDKLCRRPMQKLSLTTDVGIPLVETPMGLDTGDCRCICHKGHEHQWAWFHVTAPGRGRWEKCILCQECRILRCDRSDESGRCLYVWHHRGPHRFPSLAIDSFRQVTPTTIPQEADNG